MHRQRRSQWLWLALLEAALVTGARWTNASGGQTSSDPLLSGSSDSALTTPGPPASSTFTWTGTDASLVRDVASCESAKRAWYSRSSDWYWATHSSYSYSSVPGYSTIWLGNYTGPISTFCDGVPRASGPAPVKTVVTQYYVNSIPPPFPEPSPTCTFDYHGCELVVSSFRSWYATTHPATVSPPLSPLCEWGPDECIMPYGEDKCRLDAGEVKLMYWPRSKDPDELCAKTKPPITAAPTPTAPVTIVSDGYTFSSPSVYLSFSALRGLPCYKTWENAIIPIESTALSSLVFGQTLPIERTTSLNWDDMNSPVPLSAYKAQQSCWDNWLGVRGTAAGGDGCNTVYDDYLPWLALPTNPAYFTAIDPLFANCTNLFWRKYVFDPPYVLTPVGEILPPTLTAKTTNHVAESAALPSASVAASVPAMTTIAQPRYRTGPIATVDTQPISADPSHPHNIIINGETMLPGQITVIGNTPVIMGTGAVVIGSSTVALPGSQQTQQPVATFGTQVVAADGTNFVLPGGDKTLTPGAVTVINRVTVSVASSALIIGGSSTIALPSPADDPDPQPQQQQQPIATLGPSHAIISAQGTNLLLPGGATLSPGSTTLLNGVPLSANPSALIIDGTSTIALAAGDSGSGSGAAATAAANASPRPLATLGTQVILASGTAVILPGAAGPDRTLAPGVATVLPGGGTTLSVGSAGLVVNGRSTIALPATGAVLTAGAGRTAVTALLLQGESGAPGVVVVGGSRTISAGGPAATITVSGGGGGGGGDEEVLVVSAAGTSAVVAVVDGTATTTVAVSSLRTSARSSGAGAAATTSSLPGAGWATDIQRPSSATSSTHSGGYAVRVSGGSVFLLSVVVGLVMI